MLAICALSIPNMCILLTFMASDNRCAPQFLVTQVAFGGGQCLDMQLGIESGP
jgi:hypothetical protein